jgi:hypothetical protein
VIYIGHKLHEMLKDAEGFVAIDSCLQHFSPSAEKHGVVIWGSTRWTQFGYSHNKNLQFHMKINGMKKNSLIAILETTWLNLN